MDREQQNAAWYLAGIMDGEGCVAPPKIVIGNSDDDIIEMTCEALEVLGIRYTRFDRRQHEHTKMMTIIQICARDETERFYRLVPMQSQEKLTKLVAVVNKPRCSKMTEERFAAIRRMRSRGHTWKEVQKAVGIGETTRKRWVSRGLV